MTRSLAGFCGALLPAEVGGPDAALLAERVERHLGHAPREVRLAVLAGVAAVDVVARVTTRRRLDELDRGESAALLDRMAGDSRVALALDGLKSLVVLAHGAEQHRAEMHERGSAAPPARPDGTLRISDAAWWPTRSRADAVVVGSGAGGAMVARTLARAGLEVVVLEEGRRWTVDEFRTRHPLERYAELYRDGGTTVALGAPPIVLPLGRGVGGTTLVNSGTCYRTPRSVLERWRDEHGLCLADPDRFATYLDDVESTLQVGPVPLGIMGRNGRLLLDGAARLGWHHEPIVRNAPGCVGACQCAIGCPSNAKGGVHLTVLPDACAHGAHIVTGARVRRVLTDDGRATGVTVRRADGSRFEISAPIVVVAAGTTETPGVLRRSGLGRHRAVGRNLTVHPALGLTARFDEPVLAWRGVLQSAASEQFHADEGILVEATSTPPGMGSMMLPGYGERLLREIDDADHLAAFGAMIADRPSGRVDSVAGRTVIRYRLHRDDARRLLRAVEVMGEIFFSAGAEEVIGAVPGQAPARSLDELSAGLAGADPRHLHVAAFHPAGTVRAGSDPERAALDPEGRVRGVAGVWVADGSVLPTCPEVNPQVSIMAMALAIADGIVAGNIRSVQ